MARLKAEKEVIEHEIERLSMNEKDAEDRERCLAWAKLCESIKVRLRTEHPEWTELAVERQMRLELGAKPGDGAYGAGSRLG